MTHTPWIATEPDPEAIIRSLGHQHDTRLTITSGSESLPPSNDNSNRIAVATTTTDNLSDNQKTPLPSNINENYAPSAWQIPVPIISTVQSNTAEAAPLSQNSSGEYNANSSTSTRAVENKNHDRPAAPLPARSPENQSASTPVSTSDIEQQMPPTAAAQPQQQTDDLDNDPLPYSFTSVYQAFALREDADTLLSRFDALCQLYRDHKEEIQAKELEDHLHELRVSHENTMKRYKSMNKAAVTEVYHIFKELGKENELSHQAELSQKVKQFNETLSDYAHNKIQREWADMRDKLANLSNTKTYLLGLQGMLAVEKGRIKRSVEQKLNEGERHTFGDKSQKDLQEGEMLYNYTKNQNKKAMAGPIQEISKEVVHDLYQGICDEYQSEERKRVEQLLQQGKTELNQQRTEMLRRMVQDTLHRFESLKLTIVVQEGLREAGRRIEELGVRSANIDTADTLEQHVQKQERDVKGLLKRAKRLRHDRLLIANERKKVRLNTLEKNIGELDHTVTQARSTVLAEAFPMRTMRAVDDIYGALNNHGEFIRRLVNPVAADRGEEISKKHLDQISSTENGITFPLQFSIERLTKSFVEDAIKGASERLDVLERKVV